jgi:hypothetical protein
MFQQGLIGENIFSFSLGDASGQPGELDIGAIDNTKYTGDLNYIPLSNETYWALGLDTITVNSESVTSAKRVIIDSGTSLLAGPTADVENLAKLVGAKKSFLNPSEYTISCSASAPDITVTIGGITFTLAKEDYIINGGLYCLFGVVGIDVPVEPLWIMGDVFMRKVCCSNELFFLLRSLYYYCEHLLVDCRLTRFIDFVPLVLFPVLHRVGLHQQADGFRSGQALNQFLIFTCFTWGFVI